jgi:hypothetical protein
MHREVVQRWLYGGLNWHRSALFQCYKCRTIFPPLCWTNCLSAPAGRPEGNRSAPYVPLKVSWPDWMVQHASGHGPAGPSSVPQLQEKGAQQPPSGGCWLLGTISWKTYKTAQKPYIFSCVIWYIIFFKNSKLFRNITMSDNFFRGTAFLRNRAIWSVVTVLLHI